MPAELPRSWITSGNHAVMSDFQELWCLDMLPLTQKTLPWLLLFQRLVLWFHFLLIILALNSGCEITKYYWVSENSGFPKLFEAFWMETANLNIDFYRVSSRKPLSRNWVSLSNFAHPATLTVTTYRSNLTEKINICTNCVFLQMFTKHFMFSSNLLGIN